jgi:DNA polymerase elongation subunit (family B)
MELNERTSTEIIRPWTSYWICRKKRGVFSEIMQDLMQKKLEYKAKGIKIEEKATKLLMNSG